MGRKRSIVLILACVAALVGAGFLLQRTVLSDDGTSSAERNACYSLRDVLAALDDDSATLDDITPDVRAVTCHANRSDNVRLRGEAGRLRTEWGDFARASEDNRPDATLNMKYEQFVDVYSKLVNTCDDLGVEVGS